MEEHFIDLPELVQSHILELISNPKTIAYARGEPNDIEAKLVQSCATEECKKAMLAAFNWLIKTDHIAAKEIKAAGKSKVEKYSLRWNLAKDKLITKGMCEACHKIAQLTTDSDNKQVCDQCRTSTHNSGQSDEVTN